MKAYKGFDKNMRCRGFQYEEGKTYHEETADLCHSGFHACEMPIDVLRYYAPGNGSIYREVELEEVSDVRSTDDSKICAKTIKIGVKIGIPGIVKAQIEYIKSQSTEEPGGHATGDRGAASATGDQGAASATGYQSAASATGDRGAASATGYQGAASATGDQGAASATGYQSAASATGYQSAASATGDRGAASATGDRGAASATGYQGAASATGKASCAMSCGTDGRVMGAIGCALFAVERGDWDSKAKIHPIVSVAAAIVDGENIKPGVWYKCQGGKLVEA